MQVFDASSYVVTECENLLAQFDSFLKALARLIRDLLDSKGLGPAHEVCILLPLQLVHQGIDVLASLLVRRAVLKSLGGVNIQVVYIDVPGQLGFTSTPIALWRPGAGFFTLTVALHQR